MLIRNHPRHMQSHAFIHSAHAGARMLQKFELVARGRCYLHERQPERDAVKCRIFRVYNKRTYCVYAN